MQRLFYFEKTNTVAYIAGYDNSEYLPVTEHIKKLNDDLAKVSKLFNCEKELIHSFVIEESTRYKRMRVFHAKTMEIPTDAFVVDNWNFLDWLRN